MDAGGRSGVCRAGSSRPPRVTEFAYVAMQYPRPGWGILTPFPFERRGKACPWLPVITPRYNELVITLVKFVTNFCSIFSLVKFVKLVITLVKR